MITIEYNERKSTVKVVGEAGEMYSFSRVKVSDETHYYRLYYIGKDGNLMRCIARYPKDATAVVYCDVDVTVEVSPNGGGTATGGGFYPCGAGVVLSAKARENYAFRRWADRDGKTIGTVPNMTLVADTDTYARAEFVSEKQ
jgi:hypothetical protein